MTKVVDYFFSIGSPWAFIGFDAFLDLARRYEFEIKPYLTTVIEENGGIFSRNRPEARRAYGVRDLKRWAKVRGKSLLLDNRPVLSDPTPASLAVIAAYLDGDDWIALTRALQEAFWIRGEDIGVPEVRRRIADTVGLDGAALLRREQDEDVGAKWASGRAHARQAGVFGFPTYGYDGEVYWGQDNLPFLERHLAGDPL
ncbi:DsbA family protein [Microvirga tunisiensis]|uniref:2-hydroxychromene-2-carboxylate isomerase n=1 Tax=Microvirga tunisiensis TaxID=2108360 RepID=A0A5N7MG82_9HYPH|nr:2-hydroxychromene-2-carboxylate isomerase [Microvirga tunisiensis]MPR25768.1 2-hydroxychromene-2-carboxylate isomerase [Microvirga tunisiensis]